MGTYTIAYFAYAAGQAMLAVWAFSLVRKERTAWSVALLLPIATVVYDNLIIALGSFIGFGPLLEALTVPRFAGHALFTPIWIVAAVGLAAKSGAFPQRQRPFLIGSWVLYACMVAVGLFNEVISFVGEEVVEGDVIYYTNIGRIFTPPPPSLTMLLVVLICGVVLTWRVRWPWMLVGSLIVLASQAVRTDAAAFVFINSAEVLMSASLVATLAFLQRRVGVVHAPPR